MEDADHILAVSEDEEGLAEGGWGKRYTHSPLPPPPTVIFYFDEGDVDRLRASYSLLSLNHNMT